MTAKQRRFCEEYLKDFQGVAAARRAGYSKRTSHVQASLLLGNPKVKEYIEGKQKEEAELNNITREYFVKHLRQIIEDKNNKPNEQTNAMTLLAKVTGNIRETSPDAKQIVVINQHGFIDEDRLLKGSDCSIPDKGSDCSTPDKEDSDKSPKRILITMDDTP